MRKQFMMLNVLAWMMAFSFSPAEAADWEQSREQGRDRFHDQDTDQDWERFQSQGQFRDQERLREQDMYGWELMTDEERAEHRARMRSLHTEQEREAYRREHHEKMRQRAWEKGITLPEMPAVGGRGLGPGGGGMGPGDGMGSGGGMGPGGSRGR